MSQQPIEEDTGQGSSKQCYIWNQGFRVHSIPNVPDNYMVHHLTKHGTLGHKEYYIELPW